MISLLFEYYRFLTYVMHPKLFTCVSLMPSSLLLLGLPQSGHPVSTSLCLLSQCKSIRLAMVSRFLLKCQSYQSRMAARSFELERFWGLAQEGITSGTTYWARLTKQSRLPLGYAPWHHKSCMVCLPKPRPIMSTHFGVSVLAFRNHGLFV